MRVAAIEIGSRAVRLAVGEAADGELRIVDRRAEDLDLMQALREGCSGHAVKQLALVVDGFRRRAADRGAENIMVFGTEALRRIVGEEGTLGLGEIELLSPKDEAFCSFLSAVRGLGDRVAASAVATIDQGNGSLEIATGDNEVSPAMHRWWSLPLGSDRLVNMLRECDLKLIAFRDRVDEVLEEADLSGAAAGAAIIQGSVATKLAWIQVRRDLEDRYDGERVHGYRVEIAAMKTVISNIHKTPVAKWDQLSRMINPQDRPTDQVHRLVTGCIAFERILKLVGCDSFLVSSHGTRHGLIWKVAGQVGRPSVGEGL